MVAVRLQVVEALMNLAPDYWEKLLNVHAEVSLYPTLGADSTKLQTPGNERDRGDVTHLTITVCLQIAMGSVNKFNFSFVPMCAHELINNQSTCTCTCF